MTTKLFSILLFSVLLISMQTAFCQTSISHSKKTVLSANPEKDTTIKSKDFYLEFRAAVRQLKGQELNKTREVKLLESVLITMYSGDIPYSEIWTNKKGKCSFKLPLDNNFKIQISKKGFVTKHISVSTKIPNDKRGVFSFSFDIDLFKEVKGLDVSILKKPIAKVEYNFTLDAFAYDVGYTSRINTDLKKMYKNYYKLQKIEDDSTLFKKDTLLTVKKN